MSASVPEVSTPAPVDLSRPAPAEGYAGVLLGKGVLRKAWMLVMLLAAGAGVACGGGGAGSTDPGDPTATAPGQFTTRCHTADVQARVESSSAAGGSAVTVVSLTGVGAEPCALEGYTGLQLLDRSGAGVPIQVTRSTDVPIRRLILAPGRAAIFEVRTRPPAAGTCTPVTGARLKITLPDEPDSLTVDAGGDGVVACDGQLSVTAMQART
jgi:hypothetical protein